MDGGAWCATVQGVSKSRARLSDFTFTFHFHTLEKEMATHSSILGLENPRVGEPDGLPSMGSQSQTRLKRLISSSMLKKIEYLGNRCINTSLAHMLADCFLDLLLILC